MSTNRVKFKRLSLVAYQLIQRPDPYTIYFILDRPFIYVDGIQYGLILDAAKHLVNSLSYDNEQNELIYTISGDSSQRRVKLNIPIATSTSDGLMSAAHVVMLESLNTSMGDVTNVEEFVDSKIAEGTDPQWNEV